MLLRLPSLNGCVRKNNEIIGVFQINKFNYSI